MLSGPMGMMDCIMGLSMKINCTECKADCGEIRDGSLLKGLKFICPKCESKRIADKVKLFNQQHKKKDAFGINDVFNMFK